MQTTEAPALQTDATTVSGAPPFLNSYSTQTNNFITAVGNLPSAAPSAGASDTTVVALGEHLPMSYIS